MPTLLAFRNVMIKASLPLLYATRLLPGRVGEAVLQGLDGEFFAAQSFHRHDHGFGGLNGGNTGDAVLDGRRADAAFVRAGAFAAGRVPHQADVAIDQVVQQVGVSFPVSLGGRLMNWTTSP